MKWNKFRSGFKHFVPGTAFAFCFLSVVHVLIAAAEPPGSPALKATVAQSLTSMPGRFKASGPGDTLAEEIPPLGPRAGATAYQWTFSQPPLLTPAVDELKRASVKDGRMQIGLARLFDPPLVVNGSTAAPERLDGPA